MGECKKPGVVIYQSYRKQLAMLTDEERGKLLMALLDYAESKTIPKLSGALSMAFAFMSDQVDRDETAYMARVERSRANGAKGGRPKKPTGFSENLKNPQVFLKTQKTQLEEEVEVEEELEEEVNNISPLTPLKKGAEKKKTNVFKESADGNTALWDALKDFQDMRSKMRKPMTDQAKTRLIHKLANLSTDPDEQIKILNQSTDHGWTDVYPLVKEGQQYRGYGGKMAEQEAVSNAFDELMARYHEEGVLNND